LSAIQEALALAMRPGVISFGPGLPDESNFPMPELRRAADSVFSASHSALQYSPPLVGLREHVREIMRWRGVDCSVDEVFITAGAQQALDLLCRLLLDRQTPVLVEEITYGGLLHALGLTDASVTAVRTDPTEGIDAQDISAVLHAGLRPGFLYVVPDGHNPLGVSLSSPKRAAIVELAKEYRIPVVEDDAYGLLYYDNPPPPALRSLNQEYVIYTGSFSKIVAPALRVGWIVCPRHLTRALAILKEATDANVATVGHRILNAYLDAGCLPAHLDLLRAEYRDRRDRMISALRRFLPAGARFSHPETGLYIWVELPETVDSAALLRRAVEECGVAFIPGSAFSVGGKSARSSLRLNFSHCAVNDIEQGVRLLAEMV
jgi:2-aminoadipate transaminase